MTRFEAMNARAHLASSLITRKFVYTLICNYVRVYTYSDVCLSQIAKGPWGARVKYSLHIQAPQRFDAAFNPSDAMKDIRRNIALTVFDVFETDASAPILFPVGDVFVRPCV